MLVVDTQFAPLSDKLLPPSGRHRQADSLHLQHPRARGPHRRQRGHRQGRPTRAGGNVVGDLGGGATATAAIIAHENVLNRMAADPEAAVPAAAWPTEPTPSGNKEMLFNGEAVQIIHQPAAHTDGDSLVFFRRCDVIATGDIFTTVMYPFIDAARGGTSTASSTR